MTNFNFREEDLINNPAPRLPVCLCLDVSPSMSGRPAWGAARGTTGVPIDELNRGVEAFYEALREDPVAHQAAEVGIIAYSNDQYVIRDFNTIGNDAPPVLRLQGYGTHIGSAVDKAVALLEERKKKYRDAGVEYYQPWLVLMTDGQPTDYSHGIVGPKVSALVDDRKLTVFPIGIGSGADLDTLAKFSPKRRPVTLKELRFREFFEWLSQSMSCISRSQIGAHVTLPSEGVMDWLQEGW